MGRLRTTYNRQGDKGVAKRLRGCVNAERQHSNRCCNCLYRKTFYYSDKNRVCLKDLTFLFIVATCPQLRSTNRLEHAQVRPGTYSFPAKSATYTGWMLSPGFGSEFASRCLNVCTRWLLNTCLPTANPSPASLAVATCDRLTVVISTSHV